MRQGQFQQINYRLPISSNINRRSASHSGLKCVNLNARSIVSKMDELRRIDTQPDIIGITETQNQTWEMLNLALQGTKCLERTD